MESEKRISFEGLECSYTIKGEGKAILLLHGFCLTGSSWSHIEKGLFDQYLIITPTLPGIGDTSLDQQITIVQLSKLVYEILKKEKIKEVVIFGHSMGGYIALEMIEKYPHIKKGLGLIHSHPYADDHEKIRNRKKGIDFINKYGSYKYVKETLPYLFDDAFKKKNKEIVQGLINEVGSLPKDTFIHYLNAMIGRNDKQGLLQRINVPVLFILGEEDSSLPLDQGLQQVTLPDTSIVKILFGIGHLGIIEVPEDVISSMKEYLDLISY